MKLFGIAGLAFLFASSLTLGEQNGVKLQGAWSGVIINSGCTVDEAFAEAAKCTDKLRGPRLALYDDTTREMFDLEPQTQATGHLGDAVTVRGALEGNSIQVSFLERLTSIGLSTGQRAPAFSARDQFGREQTLESLKGPHGTILLFFRSADW